MTVKIGPWRVPASVTLDRVLGAVGRHNTGLDDPGFCLACGADADAVEPDARGLTCERCEAPAVYGAEEVLVHMAT